VQSRLCEFSTTPARVETAKRLNLDLYGKHVFAWVSPGGRGHGNENPSSNLQGLRFSHNRRNGTIKVNFFSSRSGNNIIYLFFVHAFFSNSALQLNSTWVGADWFRQELLRQMQFAPPCSRLAVVCSWCELLFF